MGVMVIDRSVIARTATRAAYQARRVLSIPRDHAVNAFDVAESLGVEVRFVDAPSLEGMFSRAPHPLIILPSTQHRPRGRLAFTCAHELGHGQMGHGVRVDELLGSPKPRTDPEEYAADVFASTLLMPRPAIASAFERRGVHPSEATNFQLYSVSCELGVGLKSLINQLSFGLQICTVDWARGLSRLSPKELRTHFTSNPDDPAILIDHGFTAACIDLDVGEALVADLSTAELLEVHADCLLARTDAVIGYDAWKAMRPGSTSAIINGRKVQLRVGRHAYTGPYANRFLPDPEAA